MKEEIHRGETTYINYIIKKQVNPNPILNNQRLQVEKRDASEH